MYLTGNFMLKIYTHQCINADTERRLHQIINYIYKEIDKK